MRFFLHEIRPGDVIHDVLGCEHPDLSAAEEQAVEAARDLMAMAVRSGRDISGRSIEITDEDGAVLATVPFSGVLTGCA